MNIDTDAAKQALRKFNNFNATSREAVEAKYQPISSQMFVDFCDACGNDAELIKAENEIKELERILGFDRMSCFQIRTGVINSDYNEYGDVLREYSAEYEENARHAAENWNEIESKIKQAIDRVNNSKLVLFKNKKLNSLNSKLEEQSSLRNLYLSVEEQEKTKQNCINNGGKEQLEKLKKFAYERKTEIAENIVAQQMAKKPAIICIKQVFARTSSSKNGITVDGDILNNVITKLQTKLSEEILKEEVASI